MTQPAPASPRVGPAFARIAACSAGVAAALAALGYWPTQRMAGAEATWPMAVGIAVALVGAWAGSLPTVLYLRKDPREHVSGILIGLVVRFGATMALALAVLLGSGLAQTPLLLWVAIAHLGLLLTDVLGLIGLLQRSVREE